MLKALARVSHFFMNKSYSERILRAGSREEIISAIEEEETSRQ
jgi:mannitol/fructose-specific phosphotransferase system IIA component (Ntr-type)